MDYHFPAWFLLREASLSFVTSVFEGPREGIEICPTTQVFNLFHFSSLGDLEGLRILLGRKEEHPSASFRGDWTALHVRLSISSGVR